jgi:hypothetical protein
MNLLLLLTSNGRARLRAIKLFKGKKKVNVDVDTILVCLDALRAVYQNERLLTLARQVRIGIYFTPEQLEKEFEKAIDLILNEESPERRRYPPKFESLTLDNWLWKDDGQILNWPDYMDGMTAKAVNFIHLLRDEYEISGKAVAGYRLEQMYHPLCDIISLTEAFFVE